MKSTRLTAVAVAVAVAAGGFAAVASGTTAKKGTKDSGTSYVAIVHESGSTEYAAGYSFDKKFGQLAATYITSVTSGKTTGTIDIHVKHVVEYTTTGELYGTANAVQSLSTGDVSNGTLDLTHGTGGQKGHSFVGTLSGTFDSKTDVYTFHYKGIYK